ncbi:MFS transporter [Cryobacterium sp. TMT2-18-3]|uniref:MFS transporter n=1 Tax=unclassified Cryobacterium TaxID=2649013 RepID=UPI00106B3DF5|nr:MULTISPECIES: MFS transporter [unclassified Cryobacterium]TFC30281.1 MFS transporter [Cryobacterium sp. TMT2-18-2]TFC35120.1 MFS transporter [Cryobacterium sp. TMT2-42-4]TFC63587.1 MFS transporter [Cryobacterium sp. TMT2-18-3]
MTAPGQTAGLSVFTDPLIAELGVSRTDISVSYLIGTLLGASAQPVVGRALDRWGARPVTISLGAAFALILFSLSFVGEIGGLTAGFVGVRMVGQGALTLATTTAVARAIHHRRGLALGLTSAIGSAGISLAPIGLERLIAVVGIHNAWRWEAAAVAVIVIPLAFAFPRRSRRTVPTGLTGSTVQTGPTVPSTAQITIQGVSWTLPEAIRTGMFWLLAASLATSGMLTTGLAFHQIALLGEQGLSPLEAAANFLPQTITGILATVLTGSLVDRVNPKLIMVFAMSTLTAALLMLPLVGSGWTAVVYGLVLGAAGGSLRGMEAASYVRFYGTLHIGSIRGVAMSISLASTAFGPVAFSLGFDATGGFTIPAMVLALIPISVAVLALFVRPPRHA